MHDNSNASDVVRASITSTAFDTEDLRLFARACIRRASTPHKDDEYAPEDFRKAAVWALAQVAGEGRRTARMLAGINEHSESILAGWMHLHKKRQF